eukprot:CAMPEP_0115051328 /NCGR_PEP_ID=MMETSP0227-20121206/2282_1 /TAXON_ID=89957 /ORGANISM="Polarella glacialis, Strain CCMP 1383" /LENGTH=110 /DNA_ID=CAMNT_0002435289 /DNA_START=308 /DNA_END=640 /DNA_ORIENTATION=+
METSLARMLRGLVLGRPGFVLGVGGWCFDVLQAERANLIPLQPLVNAVSVKAVAARQPTQLVIPLKLAQAHRTARLLTATEHLWRELDDGHGIDQLLASPSRLWCWLLSL